ncbi:hypothetical protein ON010_g8722 [Phytophthora cinnamomi]|nr:hypothetical protein ON010_g8722 [Phytophthora cinnamomi]
MDHALTLRAVEAEVARVALAQVLRVAGAVARAYLLVVHAVRAGRVRAIEQQQQRTGSQQKAPHHDQQMAKKATSTPA